MEPPKLLGIVLTVVLLFQIALTAKQAVVSRKSKLCGNVDCEEVLFKARVKRVMGINNDPSFLNLAENAIISVVAVKFSDRPDIMEGKLNGEGANGFFYAGAIDITPFAEFLRTAIEEKKEMLMISQNPADTGDKKIVGFVHSETDLIRDYNAKNAQAAAENGLPAPEPLPIPEPAHTGHGHSHGGHGHSHGGHGHSHGHPAPTPAAVEAPKAPKVVPEPVKTPEVVPEPIKAQEPAPETPDLNSVLGNPPKLALSDMDLEIEKMIKEEEERLAKQEPLVLKSLPAEPLQEIVPEPVTAAPVVQEVTPPPTPAPIEAEPIAQYIQEPTTTPTPPQEEVTTPAPIIQEVPVPEVPVVPVVEEPTTTPAPQEPEPVAQTPPPVEVAPPVAQTPPPVEVPAPVVEAAPVDDLTTPPPLAPAPAPEAHDHHGHSHGDHGHSHGGHGHAHDGHDHGHSHEAPKAPEEPTTPPPASQEEAEFLKWEEERKKREAAQPYEDAQGHQFKDLPLQPPASAGLIDLVRSSLGLGNITDASVLLYINLTFVLGALLFYIIVRTVSSGSDSDVFDRQGYFELVTKHKQLLLQLQSKQAEIQNLQANGVQQQQQVPNHEPELLALRQQIAQLQNELHGALSHRQEYEQHYNQLREIVEQKEQQVNQLNDTLVDYQERLERSTVEIQEWEKRLDAAREELNESQQTAYGRQQEALEKQQENDRIQQTIHDLNAETRALNGRILQLEQVQDELNVELKDLQTENTGLLATIQQLEKDLEASKNNEGSGGSGWSDFGDVDEVEEKKETKETKTEEKTPDAELHELRAKYKKHGEDMEEMAKLKKKLEEVEKELTKYRSLYEKATEKENRGAVEEDLKVKALETELEVAKKRIEDATEERKALFEMIKTLNTKEAEADKEYRALRDESSAKDKQLRDVEDALRKKDDVLRQKDETIRQKEDKIKEVELESKRLQREYTKLETKSFHDVMSLKKELDDVKSAQILGGGGIRDPFSTNIRSTSRNDRLTSPVEEPIWDEPEYIPSHLPPQEPDYYSAGSMTMPSRRRPSRRSNLIGAESPSDQEKSSSSKTVKKDSRRRSRSQGRQYPSYPDPYSYVPGSSDSSFLSMGQPGFQRLSGRHSKSGHLSGHYSSGGSNGGRSPPPEMPLLSAIPPPGARKPMTKRPDSAHHHGK